MTKLSLLIILRAFGCTVCMFYLCLTLDGSCSLVHQLSYRVSRPAWIAYRIEIMLGFKSKLT